MEWLPHVFSQTKATVEERSGASVWLGSLGLVLWERAAAYRVRLSMRLLVRRECEWRSDRLRLEWA
jgi:hypothetical protein